MKLSTKFCLFVTMMLIFVVSMVGCQSNEAVSESTSVENMPGNFLVQLEATNTAYDFAVFEKLDQFVVSSDPISSSEMYDVHIENGEGLLFTFSFGEPLNETTDDLQFVFTQAKDDTSQIVVNWSENGIQTLIDGQDYEHYEVENALAWQPDIVYGIFVYFSPERELKISVWNVEKPGQAALVSMPALPEHVFQFGVSLADGQVLTIHDIWKAGQSLDECTAEDVADEIDTEEGAVTEDVDLYGDEQDVAAGLVIPGYPIFQEYEDQLSGFEDAQVDQGGIYTWEIEDTLRMSNLQADLQNGQAMTFEFEFDVIMEPSKYNIAWSLERNTGDKIFIDIYPHVVDVNNQTYLFEETMDWQIGKAYRAMFVVEDGFTAIFCEVDEPTQCITNQLSGEELGIDFGQTGDEALWSVTQYLDDGQGLKLWNLKKVQIGEREEAIADNLPVPQASQWNSPEYIPNLGEFYIPNMNSLDDLVCGDIEESGFLRWSAIDGQRSVECETNIYNGSALIYEFSFTNDLEEVTSLAVVTDEGDNQKIIRFTPAHGISLKKGDQYLDDISMDGRLTWVPGEIYTMVFVLADDQQILVWPSEHPEQIIRAVIDNETINQNFGAINDQDAWQLRISIGEGQELMLQNVYQLEVQ